MLSYIKEKMKCKHNKKRGLVMNRRSEIITKFKLHIFSSGR